MLPTTPQAPQGTHPPRRGRAKARSSLRTQAQMDCVRSQGRREVGHLCIANAVTPPPDGQERVSYVVSRRYSPKAVVRNRARRLLREAFRLVRPNLAKAWIVLIPRQRLQQARMQDVLADLRSACRRLGLHTPPAGPPNAPKTLEI